MEWRPVKGYEGYYEVSEYGDVRSLDRMVSMTRDGKERSRFAKGRDIKHNENVWGYVDVVLSKDGKSRHYFVHRVVAEAFLDNPNEYQIVNHKDGNKKNNYIGNLEWCNNSYNAKHSFDCLGRTEEAHRNSNKYTFKPTCAKNIKTGEILEFDSIRSCAKYFDVNKCLIKQRLNGNIKNPSDSGRTCLDGWFFYNIENSAPVPKIVQFDKDMNLIAEYKNAHQASVSTGINDGTINSVLNKVKGYNTAGGFVWMRKTEAEELGLLN